VETMFIHLFWDVVCYKIEVGVYKKFTKM